MNFNRPQSVGSDFKYRSSCFAYHFDSMSSGAVVGKLDSSLFNFGDVDDGSVDAFYEGVLVERESQSVEVRLQSRTPQLIDWSISAIVGEDSGVQDQSTFHGEQSPLNRPNGFEVTGATHARGFVR